eukprot:3033615-Prymnesium_polylepis.1
MHQRKTHQRSMRQRSRGGGCVRTWQQGHEDGSKRCAAGDGSGSHLSCRPRSGRPARGVGSP